MAEAFYNLSIFLYRLGISLAAPFNNKAAQLKQGKRGLLNAIAKSLLGNEVPIAWFHCASLGEFEQGRPVIEQFRKEFPAYKILLTFFSPSGYEVRKNYEQADFIFYIPWDTKANARKFIEIVNPTVTFFIKYEFWHHFIYRLCELKKPIISVSSIFRENQIFFKSYGKFQLEILKRINHFFVQTRSSELLLKKFDIDNVTIAGDTRFDRVAKIIASKKNLPLVDKFKNGEFMMVVGSCWPEDLNVLMPIINASDMKFIIAPHEINGSTQKTIIKDSVKKVILYSEIDQLQGDEQVLVIDNIGLLSSLYGYGEYAYIGGAFGAGLHNILEAATYGIPIFFGNKNYQKFNEAVELIKLGGAVAINDETELRNQLEQFKDETALHIAGQVNRDYVKDNTGATDKVIDYCKKILTK